MQTANEKTLNTANIQGLKNETDTLNSARKIPESKELSTLFAKLALAGHAVHQGQCGDFTVCKYGLSRHCQDFEELQDFSRQLGVKT